MRTLLTAFVCLVLAGGCESVSSTSVQRWKTTQKGPGKLEAALRDSSVPARLRAESAAALVDVGMPEKVDEVMGAIPAGERWEIIKSLIPILSAEMKKPSYEKARAARDALFGVRGSSPPEGQEQIDVVLLPSLEQDLRQGRSTGGRHSMDKMLAAIGTASGPMLARLLEDPKVPFGAAVEMLVRVGDQASRARGGQALVKRADAMPEIPPALWRALGEVGGPAAVDFLAAKLERGIEQDALSAAQALQQRREPAVLALALKVAADPKANKAVRDEMFGVAEKIGGLEAQRGLIGIIAKDPNEVVRYRAFEAALEAGKVEAVVPALEAFPAAASYTREDVIDFVIKDIAKQGVKVRPALLKVLASSSNFVRMAAVLALEASPPTDPKAILGAVADAPTLLKLAGDRGTVRGFPAGNTVGKEAVRVADVLRTKGSTAAR